MNYHSDNVLTLLHFVICNEAYSDWKLNIVYYHQEKLGDYINFCKDKNLDRINFILYTSSFDFFKAFCKSKFVFTDNYYHPIRYKTKKQTAICLGYYAAPFKDDFFKIELRGYKESIHTNKVMNESFDYHISTSDMCSRLLSLDSLIYLPKFLSLGFPRNDILYQSGESLRQLFMKTIGQSPRKIICYAPTHRDFEEHDNKLHDEKFVGRRTIFGSPAPSYETALNDVLEKNDAIIIAKLHPKQERSVIIDGSCSRVVLYSELVKKYPFCLQDILLISDVLITDYSSTFFDFLHTDRPILYYFYDVEKVYENRGFFINPITPMCAGEVAYTMDELVKLLDDVLNGTDHAAVKRHFVHDMVNSCQDGKSSERIANYFLKQ
ncbi:MAG: CDP-glycerol glycerophosphotransferase family protein [Prevotella sp.]|nr:CDP-glycerol glycerophosphotransferase family protein [Prevotella sp.]